MYCTFVAERPQRKHFVVKGFYESTTQTQQLEFAKLSVSKNREGFDEKECKLDCFRLDSGQIGFVAGCLLDIGNISWLLEAHMLNRPSSAWPTLKGFFEFGSVRSGFFCCLLRGWSYGKLSVHNDVARAKSYRWPAPGAGITHDMRWGRHVMHAGSLEGGFTPQHVSTTNKRAGEPASYHMMPMWIYE